MNPNLLNDLQRRSVGTKRLDTPCDIDLENDCPWGSPFARELLPRVCPCSGCRAERWFSMLGMTEYFAQAKGAAGRSGPSSEW